MDFAANNISKSIRYRLTVLLTLIVTIVSIIGAVFAYTKSFEEARELQDANLLQIGEIFRNLKSIPNPEFGKIGEYQIKVFSYPQTPFECQEGINCLTLPNNLNDGFHIIKLNNMDFRVLIKPINISQKIAIVQNTTSRNEAAEYTAFFAILPIFFLYLIFIFGIVLAINSAFSPLKEYADKLSTLKESDNLVVDLEKIPDEIMPFMQSINELLQKSKISIQNQRDLVANAAHELRSPLTALSLQIENLQNSKSHENSNQIIENSKITLNSTTRLIENLLDFSRVSTPYLDVIEQIDLVAEIRNLIQINLPIIEKKNLEISFNGPESAIVKLPRMEIFLIFKNLFDNALKYSPYGGDLELKIEALPKYYEIVFQNECEKIHEINFASLLKPFSRNQSNKYVQGSGLGLSIVETAIKKIGGKIMLGASNKDLFEAKITIPK